MGLVALALLELVRAAGATPPGDAAGRFDLAVQEIDVRQVASTPMFRDIEVRCVVQNHGPGSSHTSAWVVVSRPGDDGPKVLKRMALPEYLKPSDKVEVLAQGSAWLATAVPYRCEIQFDQGRQSSDADPSNDYGEFTFPKL